jgi:aspartate-semialdehyde dehydrogenase
VRKVPSEQRPNLGPNLESFEASVWFSSSTACPPPSSRRSRSASSELPVRALYTSSTTLHSRAEVRPFFFLLPLARSSDAGTVGQRFITLLASHPFFEIAALGASSRSAGSPYPKAVKWKQPTPIPECVKSLVVRECKPEGFEECKIIFSGLDQDVAGEVGESVLRQQQQKGGKAKRELFGLTFALASSCFALGDLPPDSFAWRVEVAFCAAEHAVFSNSKNHRRGELVPLIVPTVNPSHLSVVHEQRKAHSPPLSRGFIVTNANCSTTGLVVPLKALEDAFGPIDKVLVTTLQAISGGGYPGVPSMDILDNVVPLIGGEEEKIEWETSKIMGGVAPGGKGFDYHKESPITVSASCNRVAVIDGHTECVSVSFKNRPGPSPEEAAKVMAKYTTMANVLGKDKVPSAPENPIVVMEEPDRPQPRLDRNLQEGACVVVGRIRECPVLDLKFVALSGESFSFPRSRF